MRALLLLPALLLAGCASLHGGSPAADHHQHLLRAETLAVIMRADNRIAPIEAEQLVAMLDAAGIRKATLLSMGYTLAAPSRNLPDERERVRAENDWTAQQALRFPGRLVAFCGVNPLADYAVEEVARCARLAGVKGIKLHLGNSDVQLDLPEHVAQLQRVFNRANAGGLAIAVHMRASISRQRPYGAAQARLFIEQVLPSAPDVVVQVAHMAGAGPGYADPPSREALGAFVEAFARNDPRVRNVWIDASGIVHAKISAEENARLATDIRRVGAARVLFGSDAAIPPNFRPGEAWAAFRALPLEAGELERIRTNIAPYLR